MKVIVIGGGAAGFFTAINIAEQHPDYKVTVLEKSFKLLSKVKVSGGGRCNVTNHRSKPSELVPFYPRGNKKLHPLFKEFSSGDMVQWLDKRGVATKTEEDLRMFPITDSSQTIIDCFLQQAQKHGVVIVREVAVKAIKPDDSKWLVETSKESYYANKVIMATGSSASAWDILKNLGLKAAKTVPSLFTFNIQDARLKNLQGISFPDAQIKVAGTKLAENGPLLITHKGLSGPAVLKLSAWGAYQLEELQYRFDIIINYTTLKPDEIRQHLLDYKQANPKRKVHNYPLFDLPKRFWEQLVAYCGIEEHTPFMEVSKKHLNKLVEEIGQGLYPVSGKSTFKEEFVTAGGIELEEIDLKTMECKRFPGLYLAGEVLNIDALTGGFNFQACWSVGWVIAQNIN